MRVPAKLFRCFCWEAASVGRGCSLRRQGGEDLREASRADLEVVARNNKGFRS